MSNQYIQLPLDSANLGKKVRTNERTVASIVVQEHFNIIQDITNDVQANVLTSAPSGTEGGLVTRNIPSGTQTVSVSGTVPVSGIFFQATQPVSIAAAIDVSDRSGRLLGHVTVDSAPTTAVTGTFFQATQPVSIAASVTVAQATGTNLHVVVDSAPTTAVTGTVTSNIGTTNGLALDATLSKLAVAQGAALGSNTQAMVGGSVTTSAPTYATGQISPLSLTLAGALRVDNSAVTQPVSGTFFQATQPVSIAAAVTVAQAIAANLLATVSQGGTWTVQPGNTANTTPWLTTDSSDGSVAAGTAASKSMLTGAVFNTALPTMTNGQQAANQTDINGRMLVSVSSLDATVTATALGALNASVSLAGQADVGFAAVITNISTPTGIVLTPQISCDGGTSWTATAFFDPQTGNIYQTLDNTRPKAFAAGQQYKILCGSGVSNVRVIATSWTSGSVTVSLRANDMEPLVTVTRNQASGTYTAVYQLATVTAVALSSSIAATVKQYATIYHPATAIKQARIKRITVNVESASVATKLAVQLNYLTATTAPATGNPAITPTAHRPGAAAAEATCLALPTTPGSIGATGVGLVYSTEINMGITVATTAPPVSGDISVYDDSQGTNLEPLIMRAGIAEGWAIQLASSATSTVLATMKITFVEE